MQLDGLDKKRGFSDKALPSLRGDCGRGGKPFSHFRSLQSGVFLPELEDDDRCSG
jgi:hypothetical protein